MEVGPAVKAFRSVAPGRVCLFGEHQDYLGWPVVAGAIDLACQIRFTPTGNAPLRIHLPDIDGKAEWPNFPSSRPYPYLSAALGKEHLEGWSALVQSALPQRAGASSSTALVTSWTAGIHRARTSGTLAPEALADAAHFAEVRAHGEPGGRMDHLAIAHGGLHRFHFDGQQPEPISIPDAACLLIDTLQPKPTLHVLSQAATQRKKWVADPASAQSHSDRKLLEATHRNREVCWEGTEALIQGDLWAVGKAMTAHHAFLRDHLQVSTSGIESVLTAALKAGAYGGKLNGSGGGGTVVVLAPHSAVLAIESAVRAVHCVPYCVQLGAPGAHIVEE